MTLDYDKNAVKFESSDDVFGRIAHRYDGLCDIFSFGIHRLWKRKVAVAIATESWESLLDTATGTGDIVLRVARQKNIDGSRSILASDISVNMLKIARAKVRAASNARCSVKVMELDAENLNSIESESYDCYSMSLGLKICNRKAALQEAYRVLKPGGIAVFLEASNIPIGWVQSIYIKYMELCMPLIGWVASGGDRSAYKYLLAGIKEFPSAEKLKIELEGIGFEQVEYVRLSFGIVAIHKVVKPKRA